eukprot:g37255.t1
MEMAEWVIRLVTPIPIGKYKGCLAWVRVGVKEGDANGDKQKVEEHRNVRFDHSEWGYMARTAPQPWNIDANVTEGEIHNPPTFSTDESEQISREEPRPLPPPLSLEQVTRAEDTTVLPRNRIRTPTRSSARRIRFVDSKHLPPKTQSAQRN